MRRLLPPRSLTSPRGTVMVSPRAAHSFRCAALFCCRQRPRGTNDGRFSARRIRCDFVHHGCNCLSHSRYRSRAAIVGAHGRPWWAPAMGGHGGLMVMTNKPTAAGFAEALAAREATGAEGNHAPARRSRFRTVIAVHARRCRGSSACCSVGSLNRCSTTHECKPARSATELVRP